jgi:hypothetical protein
MSSLNRTYLDFDILEDGSTSTIVFSDKSQYAEYPENPILNVLIPGFGESKTVAIISSQVNIINSNLLQIACDPANVAPDLPDGVYWLTYRISPHSLAYVTKPYLRTTILDYQFENALLTLNNTPCDEKRERAIKNNLVDFFVLKNSAKAELSQGNTAKAIQFYQLAEQILRKFNKFR